MTITYIQTPVTKSAVFAGAGVDVSGITGDWTLKIQVSKLTAGKTVRFQFTDSLDNFVSDRQAAVTLSLKGEVFPSSDIVRSFSKRDFLESRMGVANAKIKLEITAIDAAGSVDYSAWLEWA